MRSSVLRWVLAISAIAILIWFFWWNQDPQVPPAPPAASAEPDAPVGIPKCPDHPFELVVEQLDSDSGVTWVPAVIHTIKLSGDLTPVVEVHDCQKLIVTENAAGAAPSLSYGPLAVIFAGDSIKTLPVSAANSDSGHHGGTFRPQRASAVIYSWRKDNAQRGEYPALGIKGGWNCLYIAGNRGQLEAKMVPAVRQEECLLPPSTAGTTLQVYPQAPRGDMTPDDIPPVARWGWARTRGGPINDIWIRCGGLACEIGPVGFKPEEPLSAKDVALIRSKIGVSHNANRLFKFPGWYDQQLLADTVSGELVVGPILGTLMPWPDLGSKNNDTDFDDWFPVAVAFLPQGTATYRAKLNFEEGANVIFMRRGSPDTVFGAGVVPPACKKSNKADPWWAKVVSSSGERIYCMNRYKHGLPPDKMPGTTRWQWRYDDEKTWIRCPSGCCPIA